MKVGIVGLGFVGGAVYHAHQHHNISTVLHDPYKDIIASKENLFSCDAIFICVPSPSLDNGQCDTSILESVLQDLEGYQGVLISKVTAPPTEYARLHNKYKNLVHAPEFLVAATAKEDYLAGEFCIAGGEIEWAEKAYEIIIQSQRNVNKKLICNISEAAMIKYTINSFLATKVIFMNQLKEITDVVGADFNKVIDGVKYDTRIGTSHFSVPGPDGKYGFGGACFPKDTKALSYMASSLGKSFDLLDTAIRINQEIRKD